MKSDAIISKLDRIDELDANQLLSFNSGYKTTLLQPGFELWRFISIKKNHQYGAFWVDNETMHEIMFRLHCNGDFSMKSKLDNIRNSLAILEKWSKLNWRLKIRLKKEVIAHIGETGVQKLFEQVDNNLFTGTQVMDKLKESRWGRHKQFVIPRFNLKQEFEKCSEVKYFAHI